MDEFFQARDKGRLDMDALDRVSRTSLQVWGIEASLAIIETLGGLRDARGWVPEEVEEGLRTALDSPVLEIREAAQEALYKLGLFRL